MSKGQKIGCFARGGSSIALLSSAGLNLAPLPREEARGGDFKMTVGAALANIKE